MLEASTSGDNVAVFVNDDLNAWRGEHQVVDGGGCCRIDEVDDDIVHYLDRKMFDHRGGVE